MAKGGDKDKRISRKRTRNTVTINDVMDPEFIGEKFIIWIKGEAKTTKNKSRAETIIKHEKVIGRSVMKVALVRLIDEFDQWYGNEDVKTMEDIGKLKERWKKCIKR